MSGTHYVVSSVRLKDDVETLIACGWTASGIADKTGTDLEIVHRIWDSMDRAALAYTAPEQREKDGRW